MQPVPRGRAHSQPRHPLSRSSHAFPRLAAGKPQVPCVFATPARGTGPGRVAQRGFGGTCRGGVAAVSVGSGAKGGTVQSLSALEANPTCISPEKYGDVSNTSSKGWMFPFYLVYMWYLQLLPEEQRIREGERSGAALLPPSVKLIHV